MVVAALVPLSGNFESLMENIANGANAGVANAVNANPLPAGQNNNPINPPTNYSPINTGMSPVQFTMSNGQTLQFQIPTTTAGLSSLVDTSGANGATSLINSQLVLMANELAQAGDITQQQQNTLVALANQGHDMANVQSQLEAAIAGFTSTDDFQQQTVTYQGKDYPLITATWMIGVGPDGPQPDTWPTNVMDITHAGPAMATYQQLYQEAVSSGALNNPAVNAIVSELALQTTFLTEVSEHQIMTNFETDTDGSAMADSAQQLSLLNHYNSSGICSTGGHQTTGVQCQP
ncbi:MAG: hypothetical protein KTR14_05705 [Vampirovibrio sp.]|nr:hypothetical protein [Vampirovibrio sp.]